MSVGRPFSAEMYCFRRRRQVCRVSGVASSHHTGDESYTGLNSHLGPGAEAILLVRGRHGTIGTIDTPPYRSFGISKICSQSWSDGMQSRSAVGRC